MRTSRNISGPFISDPDYNYRSRNYQTGNDWRNNESLALGIFMFLGVSFISATYFGVKYHGSKEKLSNSIEQKASLEFQKYDKNNDKVLNLEEFIKYYKKNK